MVINTTSSLTNDSIRLKQNGLARVDQRRKQKFLCRVFTVREEIVGASEGPLWHPDGYWYFVDLRRNQLLRLTPGKEPELVRTTIGGNGTTYLSSQTVARSWLT